MSVEQTDIGEEPDAIISIPGADGSVFHCYGWEGVAAVVELLRNADKSLTVGQAFAIAGLTDSDVIMQIKKCRMEGGWPKAELLH